MYNSRSMICKGEHQQAAAGSPPHTEEQQMAAAEALSTCRAKGRIFERSLWRCRVLCLLLSRFSSLDRTAPGVPYRNCMYSGSLWVTT